MAREVIRTRNIGSLDEIDSLSADDLVSVYDRSGSVGRERYVTVTNFADSVATRAGVDGVFTLIVDARINSGALEVKTRDITFTDGVATTVGAESAWTSAPLS
jgi:hypothetical protein